MDGRCLWQRRLRQLMLTFFFLFLTFHVFSNIMSSPGAEEYNDLQPHRHLLQSTTTDSETPTTMDDIFEDELPQGDLEKKRDPNKPYSMGLKISDWDEQRSRWLQSHPEYPNFVADGKPRLLLVTGSSPKPCDNPLGDHYLLKSIKNKADYCRIHGHAIYYSLAVVDEEMTSFWSKLPLVRSLLLAHPEVEFVWWMDSDAMFTDMVFELPWDRYTNHNLIMHGWDEKVYNDRDWVGLNTGAFLIRNCQWSLDLLDTWATMGPKGKVREDAGRLLTKYLRGRPVFEADDQSAIVYILATQKEKWGAKVYLEDQYYLHGYWGMVVERYEEMIEKHRPGLGDHRWPLVTHFTGCKPCGKFGGDYAAAKCFKQMERAFNFGDNQVMQMYGFEHKSLASKQVKKVRNETDRPAEMEDDLGLRHPSFKIVTVN